jgi:hypothetical protein
VRIQVSMDDGLLDLLMQIAHSSGNVHTFFGGMNLVASHSKISRPIHGTVYLASFNTLKGFIFPPLQEPIFS